MSEPVQWLNDRAEGKFIEKVSDIERRINFVKDRKISMLKLHTDFSDL